MAGNTTRLLLLNTTSGRRWCLPSPLLPILPIYDHMQVEAPVCGHMRAPTGPEFTLSPPVFRTMILERIRLPLDIAEARCECGGFVDSLGRHRAACPRSERTLARMCREAGAVVEGTDFGQSRFGQPDLTNLAKSNFGQSNFGQSI